MPDLKRSLVTLFNLATVDNEIKMLANRIGGSIEAEWNQLCKLACWKLYVEAKYTFLLSKRIIVYVVKRTIIF